MRDYSISDIRTVGKPYIESICVLAQNFGELKIRRPGGDAAKFDMVLLDDFPNCLIFERTKSTIEYEIGSQCINLKYNVEKNSTSEYIQCVFNHLNSHCIHVVLLCVVIF